MPECRITSMKPDGREALRTVLSELGLDVAGTDAPGSTVELSWEDRTMTAVVTRASQVTGARARELIRRGSAGPELVVGDRITADARSVLREAGWSWLDLRGHLHLRGGGLLIDTAVDDVSGPTGQRVSSPVRGRAGLAVAYWLCEHPDEALSPTRHSATLGFAPSTISTTAAALAEGGLVDEDRRGVLPELFWELADAWRPRWTWLAGRPEPEDVPDAKRGTSWVLTGDRVAAAIGAPLVSAGKGPPEFFVPGPIDITVAGRRYGVVTPGTGMAAVAVAPVRQVLFGQGRLDGWQAAPDLAVALGLAGDPARGREILQDWPGEGHVWL
jgi:hypothetical protein